MSREFVILMLAVVGIVFGVAGFLAGKRSASQDGTASPRSDSTTPLPRPDVNAEVLARIDATLASLGITAAFHPPASEESLGALESSLGCALPNDVRTLYRWHDGGETLIPGMTFYSLAEIGSEHQLLAEILESGTDTSSRELVPIAGADGQYLLVRCGSTDRALYASDAQQPKITPQFGSVGHLLQVLDEAYASRAFYHDYSGWRIDEPLYRRLSAKIAGGTGLQQRIDQSNAYRVTALDRAALVFDRFDAIRQLGEDPLTSPTLVTLLRDPDRQIVLHTAFQLGQMRAREAIPDLLRMIRDNDERAIAASSLSQMLLPGDEHLVPVLVALLDHPDKQIRISALQGLGAVRSPRAVPQLIKALRDEDPGVLPYVVQTLGRTGDSRALIPLQTLHDRVDALGLDPSSWGGTRGSKPNPAALKSEIRTAISFIEAVAAEAPRG